MHIGNVEVTNMVMIYDKPTGKVLAQDRRKCWKGVAFPGGHLEAGESVVDSAIREVKEETGLDVKNLSYCGLIHWSNTDNGDQTLIYYYKTADYSGELKQSEEGENFWTDLKTIKSFNLAPGFERQIEMFLNDDFHELFITYDNSDAEPVYRWF